MIRRIAFHSLAAALAMAAASASAQSLAFQREGTLRWACGGVGAEERRALSSLKAEANVEVLFASAKRGSYLAGAELSIADAAGAPIARIVASGPFCLIDAPPGSYRLTARLEGTERSTTVRAAAKRGAPTRAVLTFPDEPWDGVRASEEEKRQAREP